jgi:hypothetical protein
MISLQLCTSPMTHFSTDSLSLPEQPYAERFFNPSVPNPSPPPDAAGLTGLSHLIRDQYWKVVSRKSLAAWHRNFGTIRGKSHFMSRTATTSSILPSAPYSELGEASTRQPDKHPPFHPSTSDTSTFSPLSLETP